jgi:error-prone DNA polymerase
MVAQAALGLAGIGIADRNTVAGVVRAHVALKGLRESHAAPEGFRLVVGARLVFTARPTCWPIRRPASAGGG